MEVRRTMDVCEKEHGEEDKAKKRSEHLKGKVALRITKMIRVLEATKPSDLVSAQLNAFCCCNFLITLTIRENQMFIIEHGGCFSCGHVWSRLRRLLKGTSVGGIQGVIDVLEGSPDIYEMYEIKI